MSRAPKYVPAVTLCLVTLGMALPAAAQEASRVELSGGYSFLHIADDELEGQKNWPAGWYGEVAGNITRMIAVVGSIGGTQKSLAFDDEAFDLSLLSYTGGVRLSSRANPRVVPFVHVLGGGARLRFEAGSESDSETDRLLVFGGGVNLMPRPNIGVRLGADFLRVFADDENTNVLRLTAGVVLPLGRR